MKLSTAKFLDTIEVQNDGGSVLKRARMIFSGKVNDRLGAEEMVHQISNSVFQRDVLVRIAESEEIEANKENIAELDKLLFHINLGFLKLQIFSLLDREDARTIWKNILLPDSLQRIQSSQSFFYHISHGPLLLLSELLSNQIIPQDDIERISNVFPRSCIVEDYRNGAGAHDPESETYSWMKDIKNGITEAQKLGNTKEVARLQKQLEIIQANIARYLS